jgi:hypothetical protein
MADESHVPKVVVPDVRKDFGEYLIRQTFNNRVTRRRIIAFTVLGAHFPKKCATYDRRKNAVLLRRNEGSKFTRGNLQEIQNEKEQKLTMRMNCIKRKIIVLQLNLNSGS